MSAPPAGLLELRCPVQVRPGQRCNRLLAYVAPDARLEVLCRHCASIVARASDGTLTVRAPRRATTATGDDRPAVGAVVGRP